MTLANLTYNFDRLVFHVRRQTTELLRPKSLEAAQSANQNAQIRVSARPAVAIMEHRSKKLATACTAQPLMRVSSSATFDDDAGLALHHHLTQRVSILTFSCDAYALCQEGGVENSNGRIKRRLRKRIELSAMTEQEVDDNVMTMNTYAKAVLRKENAVASIVGIR